MTNLTKTRGRFTAQQKAEAVKPCYRRASPAMPWPSALAFPPAAWLDGFDRPALIVGKSVLTTRARSPARNVLSLVGSVRRCESSGGRRIF
jgi:hypothetical protein